MSGDGRSARWPIGCERGRRERFFGAQHAIVVGDFNVELEAVDDGLVIAPGITKQVTTDLTGTKRYDQILCETPDATSFTGQAGSLDFCGADLAALFPHRRLTKGGTDPAAL